MTGPQNVLARDTAPTPMSGVSHRNLTKNTPEIPILTRRQLKRSPAQPIPSQRKRVSDDVLYRHIRTPH
jgi:hypothetical protein